MMARRPAPQARSQEERLPLLERPRPRPHVDWQLIMAWAPVARALGWYRRRGTQTLLPELALWLGRSIRAGRPLEAALDDAAQSGHPNIERVSAEITMGRPAIDAIDDWLARADGDAERLLAAAVSLGGRNGGNLAHALDIVGEGVRDDLQLDARRRTLLTQSRLSALVLVALPVVFALAASGLQGQPIYRGSTGVVLLAVGLGLDALGLLWIRRLLRGLR